MASENKDMMGTNKRIIRARGHEFLAEDEGNRTRISIKIDGAWEHAATVNTDNQTATEWIEANAKPGDPSRWLPSAFSRPGAKDMMAGEDFAARLRSLITRFGFRPDEVNVSSRFGVGTISFRNQKGKATELVSKLRGAMKQSGVPESAITAREVQYPADEDGPAEHWGIVNVDFNKMPHSRPGAKARFKVEDRFYFGKGRKERFAEIDVVNQLMQLAMKEGMSDRMKPEIDRILGSGSFDRLFKSYKSALISKRIMELKRQGKSTPEAFDLVLGAGAYKNMVGELYDALRAKASSKHSRPGAKERFWASGYDNAKERVRRSAELGKYAKIIMQPEFDSADHWDWVSTASIGEIVNWAKSIARNI